MALLVSLASLPFDYDLRLSDRRRTLEVQVRGAKVVVRAPRCVSQRVIDQFLTTRSDWVLEKLALYERPRRCYPEREYRQGAPWWYWGGQCELALTVGATDRVHLDDGRLCVQVSRRRVQDPQSKLQRLISQWYRSQAQAVFERKVCRLTESLGLNHSGIKLKKTRSRWGHCTADGQLQFNWLIVQAPEWVIDYLVAHEVCHLRHFHHGPQFWSLVAEVCPHYAEAKQWLKINGHCLWF